MILKMRLHNQLIILFGIFSFVFLIIGISVYFTSLEVSRINQQEQIANSIVKGAYQLSYLSNDYLFHIDEKRQNIQWESKFKGLSEDVASLDLKQPQEKATAQRIKDNLNRLKDVYMQSVTTIEDVKKTGKSVNPELIQVAWSRFVVQNQGMIFDAAQLSTHLHEESTTLEKINTILILILMGAFLLILLIFYYFFQRRIFSSLKELSNGTRIIGSGDLHHQIEKTGEDEIGDLSDDFNMMTLSLQRVMTSMEELEHEIDERVCVEQLLRESEERFRGLFEHMSSGVVVYEVVDEGEDFIIKEFNTGAEKIEQISRNQVIGKRVTEAFPKVKEFGIFELFQQVYRTGEPEFFPEAFYPDDRTHGSWRANWIYRMPSGEIVAIYNDITKRKQDQDELQVLYSNLEERVRERTFELEKSNQALEDEIVQRTIAEENNLQTLSILNATIESTEEGILVLDNSGNITKFNSQFVFLWRVPPAILLPDKRNSLIEFIASQVKNTEDFFNQIQDGFSGSTPASSSVIELIDGRIFEWYSKPQKIGDSILGNIFSFRDVTARKEMEKQIEKSLREKEMLLKEIHHRVKNNMQIVSSLLFMQGRKTKDTQVIEILRESQNRIKSIALVHEKIYQSKDLEQIDYHDYLKKITSHLFESYQVDSKKVTLDLTAVTVYLSIEKAVPCSLIINELISNSIKYAFPDNRTGIITIAFNFHEGMHILKYQDNGIGMPEGFNFKDTGTLGLELVIGLVHQLRGTMELNQTDGIAYTIRFP